MALLIGYFFIIGLLTGSFLNRFDAIMNNSYLNLCSYDQQPLKILIKRIAWDFLDMCVYQNIIIGFVFILAFFFQKNILSYFKLKDSFSFFFVSSAILILSCNFMSISLTSYSPMCIDPRHYLFLIPIVSIPASIIITQFIKEKKQGIAIIIILLGVTLMAFCSHKDIFSKLYLPVTLLFLVYIFLKNKNIYQILFVVAFVIILFLPVLNGLKYARQVQYRKQKEIVFEQIINKNEACYVITNDVQKRLCDYYTGFNPNSAIKFITYNQFMDDPNPDRKNILLNNKHTLYLSGMNDNDLPYYVRNVASSNKLLFENSKLNMQIFEMTDLSGVDVNKYTVFHTFNDMEALVPYWNPDFTVSENVKYSGLKSNIFSEYSATFVFPLDSLHLEDNGKLVISCNLNCYFESATNSQVVIAVESEDNTYIWRSFEIGKFLRAYSHWYPAKCETEININEIINNSILKIYVWNENKKTGYIDNFEIRLIVIK